MISSRSIKAVFALMATLGMASSAHAIITLTPSTAGVIPGYGYGPSNCENTQPTNCVEAVFGTSGLSLLYKDNVGGGEEGSFTSSYSTFFYDTISDPSDAFLFFTGGSSILCTSCYLAIKDGNSSPGYYFYNLSGWNGVESISFQNFWPGRGAISHISIWGGGGSTSVPEPATLGLLGLGLLGIGVARRKVRR